MIVCAAVVGPQVRTPAAGGCTAGRATCAPQAPAASPSLAPAPPPPPPTPTPLPHRPSHPQNNPLFLQTFVPTDDEAKFHCLVHCSLDAVEEKGAGARDGGRGGGGRAAPPGPGAAAAAEEERSAAAGGGGRPGPRQ
jgi:hypothetical protein